MLYNSSIHQNDVFCARIDVSYHSTLSKPVRFLSEQHKGSFLSGIEFGRKWQKSKSNCLVYVWSIRVTVKTITMMSNLVNFYLIVFIVWLRVDQYQIWKKKRRKVRFCEPNTDFKDFLISANFCQFLRREEKMKGKNEGEN